MELPECAWDLEQGLVVLWRVDGTTWSETQAGWSLVVAPQDGAPRYFAGDWPAGEHLFALRAPRSGRFEIQFYPLNSSAALDTPPPSLLDGTPAVLRFDEGLEIAEGEEGDPVGPQPIQGWLLAPSTDDSRWPEIRPLEVPPDATLIDALADAKWTPDGHLGLALARHAARHAGAARGPIGNTLRPDAVLDCIFTLVPDETEPPLALPDFKTLFAPAIYVDVTGFGAALDDLRAALWFFHRRHGPDQPVSGLSGCNAPIWEDPDTGRCYLECVFDQACHIDQIGVYAAGGIRLEALPDASPDEEPSLALRHRIGESPAVTDCVAALFLGDACLLLPEAAQEYRARGQENGSDLGTEALHLRLNTAWLYLDDLLDAADWQGAAEAGAFTQLAYVDLLERTLADEDPALVPLADRLGIGARRFADFARRPQLAYALVQEPNLRERLGQADGAADTPTGNSPPTPAAMLAALLEPDAVRLSQAIVDRSPGLQRAIWLYLLAGGSAHDWLRLDIPAQTADECDLADLARRIHNGLNGKPPSYVVTTLMDIGAPPLPDLPLKHLPQILARAKAMEQATAALRREMDQAATALRQCRPGQQSDLRHLLHRFDTAYRTGRVADPETLRARLLAALSGATDSLPLRMVVTDLRTRTALWWLADALDVSTEEPAADVVPPTAESTSSSDAANDALRDARVSDADTNSDTQATSSAASTDSELAKLNAEPSPSNPAEPREPNRAGGSQAGNESPDPAPPMRASTGQPATHDVDAQHALAWCQALLLDSDPQWPPKRGAQMNDAGANTGLEACEEALGDRKDFWRADDPQPDELPAWTDHRAARQREIANRIAAVARRLSDELPLNGAGQSADLHALLRGTLALHEQIAADVLWAEIKQSGASALRATQAGSNADLAKRLEYAGPSDWDVLAQELDAVGDGRTASG